MRTFQALPTRGFITGLCTRCLSSVHVFSLQRITVSNYYATSKWFSSVFPAAISVLRKWDLSYRVSQWRRQFSEIIK